MTSAVRVRVTPASGRRESLAALVLVLAVLALSSAVVLMQRQTGAETVLPQWQVDLRSGLNAAEQGLTADLLNAAAEIPYLQSSAPAALAAEGLPPFAGDATSAARGGHLWQSLGAVPHQGWLGRPTAPGIARPILLRIAEGKPSVWIAEADRSVGDLGDAALIAAGWRQVVTRYDASVTRRDVH